MVTFLTIIQVLCAILLVTAVLLQPSKGGSFMAASTQNAHMSNAPTSFLFKLTMGLAAVLMVSSMYLSRVAIQEAGTSVTDQDLPVNPAPPSNNN